MAEKSRMFKLGYKTSGNNSPSGGARVFLCCHPDDRESWIEEISADIFKTNDCVIYYGVETDSLAETDTELTGDVLKEMRMFVVLLTKKFLTENNPARDKWYGLAVENNIPLVLIAVEPWLDKIFQIKMNKVYSGYGEYQFLDRTLTDPTVISYEEKLKKRLDQILIGSEAEEKVHNAFDGRVFLSYRKKDRSKAQRLMRLIHGIPSWADTAIWYDEYLIPGEKWKKEIDSALNKCDMVALAVTSNLMEPNNYVIDYEIPNACGKGKDIVPMAVEELSSEKIDNFEGLVAPYKDSLNPADKLVNCYNDGTEEIEEALKGYIKESVIHGNRTPEHDYLIGLAYLNGIDMERNADAAVKRITASAERGLPDAMEKLADMYQTGDGVKRDYEEAAKWLEELIKVRKQAYEESGSEEDGISLFCAYDKQGSLREILGETGNAENSYCQCVIISGELKIKYPSVENIYRYAISCCRHGWAKSLGGKIEKAKKEYTTALTIFEYLDYEDSEDFLDDQLFICNDLAEFAMKERNYTEARKWSMKLLDIIKSYKKNNRNQAYQANVYEMLGNLESSEGKLDNAEKWYEESRKILEEVGRTNVDYCIERAHIYIALGRLQFDRGCYKVAGSWLKKAKNLLETLTPYDARAKAYEGEICYNMSKIYERQGEYSRAWRWVSGAIDIFKKLTCKGGSFNIRNQEMLWMCWIACGDFSIANQELFKAKEYYQEAIKVGENLWNCYDGKLKSGINLYESYLRLGQVEAKLYLECKLQRNINREENLLNVKYYLKKAVEIAETGHISQYCLGLETYEDLEAIARTQNDLKSAKIWHDKAQALERTLKQDKK